MDKVYIIAQKADSQSDAVIQGVKLALQLQMAPEVYAYSYEHLPDFDHYIPVVTPVTQAAIVKKAKKAVEQKLAELGAEQIPVQSLWCKHLYEHASETAHQQGFKLIVKAIHASDHFLPTDWHLIRHTKVPVLFLSDKPQQTGKDVLVAVDLGSNSPVKQKLNKAVVAKGRELAAATGGKLHVVYVSRMHVVINDLDLVDNATVAAAARKRFADELAALNLPDEQIHVVAGDPELCLYELSCRLKAQYFVIGARQRQGILGHVIGNTAEMVLSKMRSHILVIPAFDELLQK